MSINIEVETEKYSEDPDALIALIDSVIDKLVPATTDSELRHKQAQLVEVARSIDQLTKLSIPIPDELKNLNLNLLTEIKNLSQSREELGKMVARLGELVDHFESSYSTKPSKKRRTRKGKPKTTLTQTTKEAFEDEIFDAAKSSYSTEYANKRSTRKGEPIITATQTTKELFEDEIFDSSKSSHSTVDANKRRTHKGESVITVAQTTKVPIEDKILDASTVKGGPRTSKEIFENEIIGALLVLRGRGSTEEIKKIVKIRMKDRFLPGDFDQHARGELGWEVSLRWICIDMKKEGILKRDSPKGLWELSKDHKGDQQNWSK